MGYAMIASAAGELAKALRAARAEEAAARRTEALAYLASALGEKTPAEAAKAVAASAQSTPANRMFGVSMADLTEPIGLLRRISSQLGAKPASVAALESLEGLAEAHAPVDARAIARALEARAAEEAADAAQKAEEKRAKEAAERARGAAYARRLSLAPQSRAGLDPILAEMKAQKPKLPAAAWKEAADMWVRRDEGRSARAARAAIESKIAKMASAAPTYARRADDRPMASGF